MTSAARETHFQLRHLHGRDASGRDISIRSWLWQFPISALQQTTSAVCSLDTKALIDKIWLKANWSPDERDCLYRSSVLSAAELTSSCHIAKAWHLCDVIRTPRRNIQKFPLCQYRVQCNRYTRFEGDRFSHIPNIKCVQVCCVYLQQQRDRARNECARPACALQLPLLLRCCRRWDTTFFVCEVR